MSSSVITLMIVLIILTNILIIIIAIIAITIMHSSSQVCRQKIAEHQLRMRAIDIEYQFDRHKLTVFFEAEK